MQILPHSPQAPTYVKHQLEPRTNEPDHSLHPLLHFIGCLPLREGSLSASCLCQDISASSLPLSLGIFPGGDQYTVIATFTLYV
ncbi:hypothetical protein BDV29DRAFT_179350 [Aspergillus leporis]|uniref:Uncharacterized protein n=1 Tax=Aspergillus leporis TaxID=41062 RepID=A0A5N5WS40_9EURO|nr:hypothetical protein BDV29DRAFT_179350 [Aspergillus leporis]